LNGIDIISSPVLEVFEHFRNPYSIVFGYGVFLVMANTKMAEKYIQRKILTNKEKYIALLIATRDKNQTLVQKLLHADTQVNEDTLQIGAVNNTL
jgi:hypothetical protein